MKKFLHDLSAKIVATMLLTIIITIVVGSLIFIFDIYASYLFTLTSNCIARFLLFFCPVIFIIVEA